MSHICVVEYYLTIKRNGILIDAATWINRKNIILSERSQSQKYNAWFCLHKISRTGKTIETESRWVVRHSQELRGVREWLLMDTGLLQRVMKCSEIRLWWWLHNSECSRSHWTVCFEWVNFIVCEIYLNISVYEKVPEMWSKFEEKGNLYEDNDFWPMD